MDNKTSCQDFMSFRCLECRKFSRDQWEICAGCEHNTGECVDCVSAPDCALRSRLEVVPVQAEEVYCKYTDTAGNCHWFGTHSGEHTIKAKEGNL